MNQQEIFDKVATHLLTQNARSLSQKGDCVYRGDKGLMCAVGCLITDEAYHSDLENLPVTSSEVVYALENSNITVDDVVELLLAYLQRLHDGRTMDWACQAYKVSEWDAGLKKIAEIFNLEYKGNTK